MESFWFVCGFRVKGYWEKKGERSLSKDLVSSYKILTVSAGNMNTGLSLFFELCTMEVFWECRLKVCVCTYVCWNPY